MLAVDDWSEVGCFCEGSLLPFIAIFDGELDEEALGGILEEPLVVWMDGLDDLVILVEQVHGWWCWLLVVDMVRSEKACACLSFSFLDM